MAVRVVGVQGNIRVDLWQYTAVHGSTGQQVGSSAERMQREGA